MNTTEINKRFCKLAGLCWHEETGWKNEEVFPSIDEQQYKVQYKIRYVNPDFCADPRLVREVLMKREDWYLLQRKLTNDCPGGDDETEFFLKTYLLDTTGLLAIKAIEWLKEQRLTILPPSRRLNHEAVMFLKTETKQPIYTDAHRMEDFGPNGGTIAAPQGFVMQTPGGGNE
jgi:hypothetical protein